LDYPTRVSPRHRCRLTTVVLTTMHPNNTLTVNENNSGKYLALKAQYLLLICGNVQRALGG
jgi:hypothetical protein